MENRSVENYLSKSIIPNRNRRENFIIKQISSINISPKPWMIPAVFFLLILLGAFFLSLPLASESGKATHWIDTLFTSTSAVCVTGLIRFDTAEHWSFFGELIIALLIQAGGLGVTIYASALLLLMGNKLGLRGREFLGFELMDSGHRDARILIKRVMWFVIFLEGTTLILLLPWFLLQETSLVAVWKSLFYTISAANNAGFDLQGGKESMQDFINNPYPLIVMSISTFIGSMSFITIFNLSNPPKKWTLDTKFVCIGMGILFSIGVCVFFIGEGAPGHALNEINAGNRFINAIFLSVNRTAGMTTIDLTLINDATTAMLLLLMFIGGASTSVAGGIKIGSLMVSIIVIISAFQGKHRASAFGRDIPSAIVLRAVAVTMLGFFTFGLGCWALQLTENMSFLPLAFDVMSALANCGWSQGITSEISKVGALILTILMFVGRLGSLYIALSIPDTPQRRYQFPEETVRIG